MSVLAFLFYVLPYLLADKGPSDVPTQQNATSGLIEQILLFTAGKGILGTSPIFYSYYETSAPSTSVCICFIFGTGKGVLFSRYSKGLASYLFATHGYKSNPYLVSNRKTKTLFVELTTSSVVLIDIFFRI